MFVHIKNAHDDNQCHVTKGYRLGELDDVDILKYAGGELIELAEAVGEKDNTHIKEEIGDTMSCLIHLAIKHNIQPHELAHDIIVKMEKRFA